jgi:hypothetical protein
VTEPFVARYTPLRVALLLLGAIVFVVGGLWIAGLFGAPPRPGREFLGWLAAAFFGLCAIVTAPRLFDRRDQIVVDRRGIYWRHWSETTIPWSALRGFDERSVRSQRFICLHLHDPTRYPAAGLRGWVAGANKGMGFGDIAMTAAGTDRSFDELLSAIEQFAPPSRQGAAQVRDARRGW